MLLTFLTGVILTLQGIYVLQDNKFRLLTQMSAGKQYLEHAPKVYIGCTHLCSLGYMFSFGSWSLPAFKAIFPMTFQIQELTLC